MTTFSQAELELFVQGLVISFTGYLYAFAFFEFVNLLISMLKKSYNKRKACNKQTNNDTE